MIRNVEVCDNGQTRAEKICHMDYTYIPSGILAQGNSWNTKTQIGLNKCTTNVGDMISYTYIFI